MKNKAIMAVSLAVMFLVILFPLWGHLLPQRGSAALKENRNLAEWPTEGSSAERIRGMEEYLGDHLAFRDQVITGVLHADLALGQSPSGSVLIGTHDWLFYDDGESSADIRRIAPVDPRDADLVCRSQQAVADTMAAAGADYRVFIAPDKHTVYPQYLPISCRTGEGPSHLDEVYTLLGERTNVRWVDVRPALIAAAEQDDQYYRYDTHWSSVGAYTAYAELMRSLKEEHPTLHVLEGDELYRGDDSFDGDLAGMVGMAGIYVDRFRGVHVKDTLSREAPELSTGFLTAYVNESIPDAPTMLIIHDSFGGAIINFLRESVSELYTIDEEDITYGMLGDLSRYDIVLMERVERNVLWLGNGILQGEEEEEGWEDEWGEWDGEWEDESWDTFDDSELNGSFEDEEELD